MEKQLSLAVQKESNLEIEVGCVSDDNTESVNEEQLQLQPANCDHDKEENRLINAENSNFNVKLNKEDAYQGKDPFLTQIVRPTKKADEEMVRVDDNQKKPKKSSNIKGKIAAPYLYLLVRLPFGVKEGIDQYSKRMTNSDHWKPVNSSNLTRSRFRFHYDQIKALDLLSKDDFELTGENLSKTKMGEYIWKIYEKTKTKLPQDDSIRLIFKTSLLKKKDKDDKDVECCPGIVAMNIDTLRLIQNVTIEDKGIGAREFLQAGSLATDRYLKMLAERGLYRLSRGELGKEECHDILECLSKIHSKFCLEVCCLNRLSHFNVKKEKPNSFDFSFDCVPEYFEKFKKGNLDGSSLTKRMEEQTDSEYSLSITFYKPNPFLKHFIKCHIRFNFTKDK